MQRSELQPYLVQLRTKVDEHFRQSLQRDSDQIRCCEGCVQCCHQQISVFSIEAESIRSYLLQLSLSQPDLRLRIRNQADAEDHQSHCAFLVDGSCSIYEVRPMICRSHGLPIAVRSENDGTTKVDCCPLNYTSHRPHPHSILALEAINAPLATIQYLWREQSEKNEMESADRVALVDLARAESL